MYVSFWVYVGGYTFVLEGVFRMEVFSGASGSSEENWEFSLVSRRSTTWMKTNFTVLCEMKASQNRWPFTYMSKAESWCQRQSWKTWVSHPERLKTDSPLACLGKDKWRNICCYCTINGILIMVPQSSSLLPNPIWWFLAENLPSNPQLSNSTIILGFHLQTDEVSLFYLTFASTVSFVWSPEAKTCRASIDAAESCLSEAYTTFFVCLFWDVVTFEWCKCPQYVGK